MALKNLFLILMCLLIGISSILAWNPNVQRFKSYDLERGPVFYEAYYPDNHGEIPSGSYQEKRFFDRGAVLERSYQLPGDYPMNDYPHERSSLQKNDYLTPKLESSDQANRMSNFPQAQDSVARTDYLDSFADKRNDPLAGNPPSLAMKEISKIARRAISRDLENWNMIENYLDRTGYQEQTHQQEISDPGTREDFYVRSQPIVPRGMLPVVDQRDFSPVRRISNLDVLNRDSLERFEHNRFQGPQEHEWQPEVARNLEQGDRRLSEEVSVSYPPENIFEPRPQVINYVFSKKSMKATEAKVPLKDLRLHGETKKSEEPKDIKVTSIEVSEVPRHKTRHHHGEWPKRDYSNRHQS